MLTHRHTFRDGQMQVHTHRHTHTDTHTPLPIDPFHCFFLTVPQSLVSGPGTVGVRQMPVGQMIQLLSACPVPEYSDICCLACLGMIGKENQKGFILARCPAL